ncbi:MAG: hypothetical protein II988_07300 [Clostridia bacterium]|nr:hypothetical protein [Clostridia bacterium]MBQ3597593.1 hypothetical protein [Clostridia bacterium]
MDAIKTVKEKTEEYLYKKLSKYTKDEIIKALIATSTLDLNRIDIVAHRCYMVRLEKERELEEKRINENIEKTKKAIDEYNGLIAKAKQKGIESLSLKEIERMQQLLKIIRSV